MYGSEAKLKVLLDITKAINNNVSERKLLELYTYALTEIIGVSKFALVGCPSWTILTRYKIKRKELDFDLKEILQNYNTTTHLNPTIDKFGSLNTVIPVYHKTKALAFLLFANKKNVDEEFTQTVTNIIAVAIENKRLVKHAIDQQIQQHDFTLAAEIQRYLVPSSLNENEFVQAHGIYKPHNQIGGDYYDLIPSGDDFYICMADVSGKGVSAAILMANFQAQLRTLIQYTELPIDDLILELNKRVHSSVNGEKFITVFLAKYFVETNVLTYINAGHNPPIVIENDESISLSKGSIGLGMMPHLPFVNVTDRALSPGTVICAYTDGIIEQVNDEDQEFGFNQLNEIVKNYKHLHPSLINSGILNAMELHRGNKPYVDDIALFSCRFK